MIRIGLIRSVLAALLFMIVFVSGAHAQSCAAPAALVNGTNADATQVNTNFSNVYGCVRDKLTAARTYFVRLDGNDSNTGLVDSPSGAFLTIAKAMSVAASIDCAAQQLTIQIDAGTWTTPISLPRVLASLAPILQGVGSTTVISTTSANAITANGATPWVINNLKLVTTTSGFGIYTLNSSVVTLSGIEWGAIANYAIFSNSLSAVNVTGNNTISGGAQYFIIANASFISLTGAAFTLTGTPAFSNVFVYANRASFINGVGSTYSGAATGVRWGAGLNGVIDTLTGGNPTFFPGNVNGSAVSGGQYN
jgi:hypothetical protein